MKCFLSIGLGCVLLGMVAGCGGKQIERKPVYPVSGKVTFQGKPATGAFVSLQPADDPNLDNWPTGFPRGTASGDGTFTLSTYEAGDGAPAGRYNVIIEWREDPPAGSETQGPDRLKGRFSIGKSKLPPVQIKEGPNTIGPFEVK